MCNNKVLYEHMHNNILVFMLIFYFPDYHQSSDANVILPKSYTVCEWKPPLVCFTLHFYDAKRVLCGIIWGPLKCKISNPSTTFNRTVLWQRGKKDP